MNKRALSLLIFTLAVLIVAVIIIAYARGYRPNFKTKKLTPTGLLVATSYPDAAQVFINGKLKTATNNTISLLPGWYDIKIVKDGYFPWEKKLKVQGEIVTKTDALLISTTPSLRALTNAGVLNPVLSPEGNRLVYGSATGSAEKIGVYVMDLNERPIFRGINRQISTDTLYVPLSRANFLWSPDGKKVMAFFGKQPTENGNKIVETMIESAYLLNADINNEVPEDITLTYETILADWDKELEINEKQRINSLKSKTLRNFVSSWQITGWTANETKILYTATASATLPLIIKPPLIGTNCQKETRDLEPGKIYVYDIREDKNFEIGNLKDLIPSYPDPVIQFAYNSQLLNYSITQLPTSLQWLPDSHHLILAEKGKISLMEYDSYNKTTVYAGPFVDDFVFPWPDYSKLVILTNYNPTAGIEANLYSVTLR